MKQYISASATTSCFGSPWLVVTVMVSFLHTIFVWSTSKSLPKFQYTIKELLKHMVVIHSDDVTQPSQLGSEIQRLNAGGLHMIQDLQVGDMPCKQMLTLEKRVFM